MLVRRPHLHIVLSLFVGAALLLIGVSLAEAREIVLTKDGRAVILNEDGTWHYALDVPPELTTGGEFDFRSAKWGMDRAAVRASEPTPVHSEAGNFLVRRVIVAGIEAFAGYLFDDEKQLNSGTYLVLNGNTDSSKHVNAYKTIHAWLEIEFGKPEAECTLWLDASLRDDPDRWAEAYRNGLVEFETIWRVGTTLIVHVLERPTASGIQHIVAYTHQPALEQLYQK